MSCIVMGRTKWRVACAPLDDIKYILADPENPALFYRRRYGKTAMIDDSVSLCRVDREYCIHFGIDFIGVHSPHVHRRPHKRNRHMRLGWCVGTDVGRDDDIAGQAVTLPDHLREFGRTSQRRDRPVRVRNETYPLGACPDAPQPAYDAERGAIPS